MTDTERQVTGYAAYYIAGGCRGAPGVFPGLRAAISLLTEDGPVVRLWFWGRPEFLHDEDE